MLSALAFNIIPTIFEVGLVTGVLVCASCHLVTPSVFSLLIQSLLSVHHSAVLCEYIAFLSLLARCHGEFGWIHAVCPLQG